MASGSPPWILARSFAPAVSGAEIPGLLCEQQGFFCFGQTGVHLAEDVEITVVVPQLESGDGMLTIKDVVVTIAVADLGRIGDALIKLSSNALDPVGIEMPLVVAARHFQKLTVDDHFVMNKFNHRQILLPVLRYTLLLSAKVQRLFDGCSDFQGTPGNAQSRHPDDRSSYQPPIPPH